MTSATRTSRRRYLDRIGALHLAVVVACGGAPPAPEATKPPPQSDSNEAADRLAATQLHTDAQNRERETRCVLDPKSKQPCAPAIRELYSQAAAAYATYLQNHAASPRAPQLRFLRAQILDLKLDRLEEGGDEYVRVAQSRPVGDVHRDAALGAVVAYDRARSRTTPSAIDRKLRDAGDVYVATFSGGPDVPQVLFVLARLAMDRTRLAEAETLLRRLIDTYPTDPLTGPANDLLLEVRKR